MKGFSDFLDMRRCKGWDLTSVPANIYLCKDLFHQFLWSTECFSLHPESPRGVEGQRLHRVQSPLKSRWQTPLLFLQSLANALG